MKQKITRRKKTPLFSAIIVSILALTGILAKLFPFIFIHDRNIAMELYPNDYWSVNFLESIGNHFFAIIAGGLLWISSNYHEKGGKSQKMFRYIALLFIAIGFYFIGRILLATTYFTETLEIAGSIVFALISSIIFFALFKFLTHELRTLEDLKMEVVDFFIEIKKVHWHNLLKTALREDDNLDQKYIDEIKLHSKRFYQRLHGKAGEILD